MKRYLAAQIKTDLARKMVFMSGPRQVGKTTLARQFLTDDAGYLNWDMPEGRERILKREFPSAPLIVFDELHKYRSWRNYLKGLYDNPARPFQILITGSARLDFYRYGGDSLQGRYHALRLHPLSIAELKGESTQDLEQLLKLGGFPEPFFGGSEIEAKRWSREYRTRLVREEITSIEQIHDLGNIELLLLRLPELVGSPLSINSLREDLQLSHATVSKWLHILERFYSIFRVAPFGAPKIKAVKKEQKHYHYDWSVISEPGARFENLVASHLLKWVHYEQDTQGRDLELHYLRDITGREVDFLVAENRKPLQMIECKLGDTPLNPALVYFKRRLPRCEAFQLSAFGSKDFQSEDGIRVCPALPFLKSLI